jgi:DNA-binding LacI/PurR family transcriptional regulator
MLQSSGTQSHSRGFDKSSNAAGTMTDRIVAELRQRIEQGKLKPGERLPSSRRLAEEFGVSLNTVQAALGRLQATGFTTSTPRRRSVVRDIGRKRGRARGSSRGLVLMFGEPDADSASFDNSWGSQILFSAEHTLSQQGVAVGKMQVPAPDGRVSSTELDRVGEMLKSASGVIWLASAGLQAPIFEAIERGLACVTINAPNDVISQNVIRADNVGGGRTVGTVFARLGYQRCLLLTRGIRYRRFAPDLAQGFLDSFMKAGIPLRGVEYHDLPADRADLAEEAVAAYLKTNPCPQGVFAVSDVIALGAMAACRAAGLRIPEDVGIVSATGFESTCTRCRPTLSAWQQPMRQMGDAAAKMLMHLIENPADRLPPALVGSSLVLRDSLPRHSELVDLPGIQLPGQATD